jgi:glycosyltransferase involved in cell wall biosynthesis
MAEPLRILVLFGSVVMFGAERGNLEALAALKRQGAEILCLVSDEQWSVTVPPALDARGFEWRKVPYIRIGKGIGWYNLLWGNPCRFVQANIAFLRAVHEFKPTHIHAYAPQFTINFAWGLARTATPLVYRAGDEPTLHNVFWRLTWRFIMKRTSGFVANSRFVAASLAKCGIAADRISLIYNAPPGRPNLTPKVEFSNGSEQTLFVYVGQIAEHKGPHLLIEAFKSLVSEFPQARLALAGRIDDTWEGDAWARTLRDQTLADDDLNERVRFLGSVEDVPALYAASSFIVVPSLFDDPSPNVVMEAKQASRAAIGFARGGIPELIAHEMDGILCAEATAPALAVALRIYLRDPELARRHGSAARLSLEHFGISKFGQKWCDVLRMTAQVPRTRGADEVGRADAAEV